MSPRTVVTPCDEVMIDAGPLGTPEAAVARSLDRRHRHGARLARRAR